MKKVLSLAMIGAMCACLMVPVSAKDIECTPEGNGCQIKEDDTNVSIKGEGTVGVKTGDENPYVDVTVPSKFSWAAWYRTAAQITQDGKGDGEVESGKFSIINNSKRGNINLTLKSFKQTNKEIANDGFQSDKLDLFLNGNLDTKAGNDASTRIDLANDFSGNFAYPNALNAGEEWTFGFDGWYKGKAVYGKPFAPTYTMTLNIKLESVLGPKE